MQAVQASSVIDRAAVDSQVEPLIRVAQNHAGGKEAYARSIAIELFEDFLGIEERFAAKKTATEQEIIDSMRLVRPPPPPPSPALRCCVKRRVETQI